MMKKIIELVKWIVALSIIWYMVSSGYLDIKKLASTKMVPYLTGCFIFTLNVAFIQALRWQFCLRAQGVEESLFRLFQYNMISMFTCIFMPGAIGGDFFRCLLVARDNPGKKATVVATVLLDRTFGLYATLLWGIIALWFNPVTANSAPLKSILWIGIFIFFGITAFSILAFRLNAETSFVGKIFKKLPMGAILKDMYQALHCLGRHPGLLLRIMPLALIGIFNAIVCFYFYGHSLGQTQPLWKYFSVVPIGFIVASIPLSPAGLGVGQAAYYKLFELNGMPASLGAEVFTLSQLTVFICGIPGVFIYLMMKSKVDEALRQDKKSNEKSLGNSDEILDKERVTECPEL